MFTNFDAVDSFFQVELTKESQNLTSFSPYENKIFKFLRLPQGLNSSSSVLSYVMKDILKHLTDNVMTYVDDILCVDVQTEQHFKTIDNVLQAFIQRGLKIKLESANFFQNSINFLGRKINSDGSFCPVEKHLSAIKNLKSPQTHSECKSVLGLINWILNFVRVL